MAISGLAIQSELANAQETGADSSSKVIEEIVAVEAPIQRERTGPLGRTIETIGLTRQVSYADLDLSKRADVTELKKRIEATAKESCEKLEEMYPLPREPSRSSNIRSCVEEAVDSSTEAIEAAIAAAE